MKRSFLVLPHIAATIRIALTLGILAPCAVADPDPVPLYVTMVSHFDHPWDLKEKDLAAFRKLTAKHPRMRWSHLYNPAAYTQDTPLREAMETYLVECRDQHEGEIGLHLHMYKSFVEKTGIPFRSSPSLNAQKVAGSKDDTGYSVPMSAYSPAEMATMLEFSLQTFAERKLGRPRSFCAGFFAASVEMQKAIAASGFTVSAAAFPPDEEFGRRYSPTWQELAGWDQSVTVRTAPYRVSNTSILPGADGPPIEVGDLGPLVEIPQTCKIDWMVSADDIKAIFAQHLAIARSGQPTAICLALHETGASRHFAKFDEVLTEIDRRIDQPEPGIAVRYGTLSEVRSDFLSHWKEEPKVAAKPAPVAEVGWHATGSGGAVGAESPKAVRAGIEILKKGGNAADAAVAVLLMASVADYGMFCLGAEVPLMVFDAKKKEVKTLSGLGSAPLDEEGIAWYYQNAIPQGGGIRAVPVPGAVALFFTALSHYGTMDFATVVDPTLRLLDGGGEDWYDELATTLRKLVTTEIQTSGTRKQKLQAARDRFYKGDIADQLAAYYQEEGSFLRKRDLEAHQCLIEDPVSIDYRGYRVYKCGPWTQGPVLCQTLKILEGFDLRKMGHLSADYIHVLAESLKLGLADRDFYYGDPRFARVPLEPLLSDRYAALRRPLVDMTKASMEVRPGDPIAMKALSDEPGKYRPGPGGTTTCVVADRWGNLVAATPSGNQPYNVCASLGIAHGNRLRSLNTTPEHPNRIEPGKRPRITLTPTLVLKDGAPVLAISVHDGDLQDQTTLNCLLNVIEFGMKPKEAVTAARFHTRHHEGSFNPSRERQIEGLGHLRVQDSIAKEVQTDLEQRGHKLSTTGGPIASPVMIYFDHTNEFFYAAGDPKAQRHAAVLQERRPRQ